MEEKSQIKEENINQSKIETNVSSTQQESSIIFVQHLEPNPENHNQFVKIFQNYKVVQPIFNCPRGNLIQRICININCKCKSALICNDLKCERCYEEHYMCSQICFNFFSRSLEKKQTFQKEFYFKLFIIQDQIIKKIDDNRNQMATLISYASLDQKYIDDLKLIYKKDGPADISSNQTELLYRTFQIQAKDDKDHKKMLQQLYNKRANKVIDELLLYGKHIYDCFIKGSSSKPNIIQDISFIDSQLMDMCCANIYENTPKYLQKMRLGKMKYNQYLDQDRIASNLECMRFLKEALFFPKKSERIFLASANEWSAAKFHQICDGKQHTLTIVRTEFGKTIFAYTPQKWHKTGAHIPDPTNRSCLVLLDIKKKMTLQNNAYAILGHPSYGPVFGQNYDLLIGDSCHTSRNSSTQFATTYNNGQFANNQPGNTVLCGQPNGKTFLVTDYEVYQLFY